MILSIHIAVDRFGAESLGKFSALLAEVNRPDSERHLFIWGGVGEPPVTGNYWLNTDPIRDDILAVPYDESSFGSLTLDLHREKLVKAVSDDCSAGAIRKKLEYLIGDKPKEMLGKNAAFEPVIDLTGSLADPAGNAILLGLLSGMARLRRLGVVLPEMQCFAFCGIGSDSGPSADVADEHLRVLAGRGLLDLEGFFVAAGTLEHRAVPVFLVGERPFGLVSSARSDQIAIAGYSLLAMTRDLLQTRGGEATINPFYFSRHIGNVRHANDRFDPHHAFAAVGAYGVRVPVQPLARLSAARLCKEVMESHLGQRTLEGVEDAATANLPPELVALLDWAEARAVSSVWDEISRGRKISWEREDEERNATEWFRIERIRQIFDPIFGDHYWEHVTRGYSSDRLRVLPLQDWESALSELEQLVEGSYVPWRNDHIATLKHQVLLAMLRGLGDGFDYIFERTYEDEVRHRPHELAQAFVGRVLNRLQSEKDRLAEDSRKFFHRDTEKSERRNNLSRLRDELLRCLAQVPSPVAVFMRLIPAFAAGLLLFLAWPYDYGLLDTTISRLIVGTGAGLILAASLLVGSVVVVRKRLLSVFERWFAHYKVILREEDEVRERRSYSELIDSMIACVKWYHKGTEKDPPVPEATRILRSKAGTTLFPVDDTECLRPQRVLCDFEEYLTKAMTAYDQLQDYFLHEFQTSQVETILPEISVADREAFDREYRAVFWERDGVDENVEEASDVRAVMRQVLQRARERFQDQGQGFVLPFSAAGEPALKVHAWRRSFKLPTGEELLEQAAREGSSGFGFHAAVCDYIYDICGRRFRIATRVKDYVRTEDARGMSQTELWNRYNALSCPSVASLHGQAKYVVSAGSDDPLAARVNGTGRAADDHHGNGCLSVQVQASLKLAAQQIIDFPNPENPATPLGLAWRAYRQQHWAFKALEAVSFPAEDLS